MHLYNIWVSLSEMSEKNIDLFHDIQFFFRCTCTSWMVWRGVNEKQIFIFGWIIPLMSFQTWKLNCTKPWISFKTVLHEPHKQAHLYVRVAGISEQWVGQPSAVFPPAVEEIQHHYAEVRWPLLQKLLPDRLQIPNHQLQDAAVLHVRQQERMNFLPLWGTLKTSEEN